MGPVWDLAHLHRTNIHGTTWYATYTNRLSRQKASPSSLLQPAKVQQTLSSYQDNRRVNTLSPVPSYHIDGHYLEKDACPPLHKIAWPFRTTCTVPETIYYREANTGLHENRHKPIWYAATKALFFPPLSLQRYRSASCPTWPVGISNAGNPDLRL